MSKVGNARMKKREWRVGKFSKGSYAASGAAREDVLDDDEAVGVEEELVDVGDGVLGLARECAERLRVVAHPGSARPRTRWVTVKRAVRKGTAG